MNETANPQPARRADAHRLAGQLSGDPLAPISARFPCQQVDGRPELALQPDSGAMRRKGVKDEGGRKEGHVVRQQTGLLLARRRMMVFIEESAVLIWYLMPLGSGGLSKRCPGQH